MDSSKEDLAIVVPVGETVFGHLQSLTASGLFGATVEATAAQLLLEGLRNNIRWTRSPI